MVDSRSQHIEIFLAPVSQGYLHVCDRDCDHSKVRWVKQVGAQQLHYWLDVRSYEWRWLHRHSNGAHVAASAHGYQLPRDVIKGLELAHPGYRLNADATFLMPVDGTNGFPLPVDGPHSAVRQGRPYIPVRLPAGDRHRFQTRRADHGLPVEVLR